MFALTGGFGLAALLFAGMGFKVDRLCIERRSRTLTCEHGLFGIHWKRQARWQEVAKIASNHQRQLRRGTAMDFYFLYIEFHQRRKWIFELDLASVGELDDYASQVRAYLAGVPEGSAV